MALKKSQESLRNWTKQKWRTSDGSKSEGKKRYLPDAAWKALSPAERAVSAAGVVAPITTGISRFTFNQGQTGSELDRLSKFGSKNLQIPTGTGVKIGQNPSTDIGRRLSNKIGKEVSSLVQNTNRRTNLIQDIKRAVSSGNYGM